MPKACILFNKLNIHTIAHSSSCLFREFVYNVYCTQKWHAVDQFLNSFIRLYTLQRRPVSIKQRSQYVARGPKVAR